jgi:hypothetical protein
VVETLISGLWASDKGLLELASAHLDAATFLVQSTNLAQGDSSTVGANGAQIAKSREKSSEQKRVASKRLGATAGELQGSGAASIIAKCARLGLWAEAKEVYECASGGLGCVDSARLQLDILAVVQRQNSEWSEPQPE